MQIQLENLLLCGALAIFLLHRPMNGTAVTKCLHTIYTIYLLIRPSKSLSQKYDTDDKDDEDDRDYDVDGDHHHDCRPCETEQALIFEPLVQLALSFAYLTIFLVSICHISKSSQ